MPLDRRPETVAEVREMLGGRGRGERRSRREQRLARMEGEASPALSAALDDSVAIPENQERLGGEGEGEGEKQSSTVPFARPAKADKSKAGDKAGE